MLEKQLKRSQAERCQDQALAIAQKQVAQRKGADPEHPQVAVSLWSLGSVYESLGKSAQAEEVYKEALAIQEKWFARQPSAMGDSAIYVGLNHLAELYYKSGKYTEAEPLYAKALTMIGQAQYSPSSTESFLKHYVDVLHRLNKTTEAADVSSRALLFEKPEPGYQTFALASRPIGMFRPIEQN